MTQKTENQDRTARVAHQQSEVHELSAQVLVLGAELTALVKKLARLPAKCGCRSCRAAWNWVDEI